VSVNAGARTDPRRSSRPEERREQPAARPDLQVVTQQPSVRRARRRQARITLGLAACVVAAALLVVAAANSLVVSQQVQLDSVRVQVAATLAQDQNLQVQRAMLESPARILSIAEHRLGMVTPSSVAYLTPVAVAPAAPPVRPKASTSSTSTRR
jgi:cell division protein FtsL